MVDRRQQVRSIDWLNVRCHLSLRCHPYSPHSNRAMSYTVSQYIQCIIIVQIGRRVQTNRVANTVIDNLKLLQRSNLETKMKCSQIYEVLNACRTSLVWVNNNKQCYPRSLYRRNWLQSIVNNSLVVRQHTSPSLLLMVSLYSTHISPQSQARKHCQLESLSLYIPGPYLPVNSCIVTEPDSSHNLNNLEKKSMFISKFIVSNNTNVQTILYTSLIRAGKVQLNDLKSWWKYRIIL